MAIETHGIISAFVDGQLVEVEGSVEVDARPTSYETAAGLTGIIRKQTRRVPTLKLSVIANKATVLQAFWGATGYAVQVDAANGLRYVGADCAVQGDAPVNVGDGTISVEFACSGGITTEEIT